MNTETLRIADQLRRAYTGDPWHGSPLAEILQGIDAKQASSRPLPSGHTIWELVLHIETYANGANDATRGGVMPKIYGTDLDWATISDSSEAAWQAATKRLFTTAEQLAQAIENFRDDRLHDIVPGRDYDFYYLFHGIVQHSLYHGGQIAMLKSAAAK